MNFKLPDFIKFITGLRGLWGEVKGMIGNTPPLGIMNFLERKVQPEWADALRQNSFWNDLKRSNNTEQMRDMSLAYAQNLPFFQGKSKEEIEEYVLSMGESLGFLDKSS